MYHREFGVFLFGDSVEWFCSVDVFWGFVDIACYLGGHCENPLIWRHGSMFQPNCWDGAMKLLWNFRWLSTAVHYTTDVTQDFWLFCSIHESYIVYLCGVGENFFAVKFYGDTQVSFIILLCSNISHQCRPKQEAQLLQSRPFFKGKQGRGQLPPQWNKMPPQWTRKIGNWGAKANRMSLPHDTTNWRIYLLSRTGQSYSGQSEHGWNS